ncbi:MAG: glycosyltransferase [Myxococcales bacterium]|nr:glycosyltransferase [Myxococcales bacterium]
MGRSKLWVGTEIALRDLNDRIVLRGLPSRVALRLGQIYLRLGQRSRALSLIFFAHRSARAESVRSRAEAHVSELLPLAHAASGSSRASFEEALGGRVLVLKRPKPGERGVLFVMFTELFAAIADQVDVQRLLAEYTLVLEPSWSGYCDRDLLFFTQFEEPIFALTAERLDYDFITRLDSNLHPVFIGSGDWVDPSIAEPFIGAEKRYDIVMNAHWGPSKRHRVLFRSLKALGSHCRVALIGGPWEGCDRDAVVELARYFGVREQIEFFERIPYAQVMEVMAAARVCVLLSLKEGANRALPEAMFCDVPVVLLKEYVGGCQKNVVPETGVIVPQADLTATLKRMIRGEGAFRPRRWALQNIACVKSGERLNEIVKADAQQRGFPWTEDLAPHKNAPESRYLHEDDERRLAPFNDDLRRFLVDRSEKEEPNRSKVPIPVRLALKDVSDQLTRASVASHLAYPIGRALAAFGDSDRALSLISRAHRMSRAPELRERCEAVLQGLLPVTHALHVTGTDPIERHFGKRLLVLKEPSAKERGVLFVMFSELLAAIAEQVDVKRLLADYTLVFEPSWSGYFDRDLLFYTQFEDPIFVLSGERGDFQFLERLASNLIPVPLAPCDWVDPSVAEPYLQSEKTFDVVMNAHWGSSKRHHVLFRALATLSEELRVALIGGSWEGGTRESVAAVARHFGVREQLEFFERIPFERVMQVTCSARCSVLLSLKEGSNRALAESMFCDVPVVLLEDHVGGIHKNIVPETGVVAAERDLAETLVRVARGSQNFQPRAWALANVSCLESGTKLNELLRASAIERGLPWTRDIAHHANSPDAQYLDAADAERLSEANRGLRAYFK